MTVTIHWLYYSTYMHVLSKSKVLWAAFGKILMRFTVFSTFH